eukprot:TRINITY_DN9395_c0_g1_i1.p1 TRINITY_DN9395_c0_g1~~TRINITY_DN9395_c0_g1_i1.p1  ORF type:complete len:476 (-),score=57.59 TRINITY_DN9395_c0_g1_i1:120-1547(-)
MSEPCDVSGAPTTTEIAGSWAVVDRAVLRENARGWSDWSSEICSSTNDDDREERVPAALCCVVKADGYGHGVGECALSFVEGGARVLAVARARDLVELVEWWLEQIDNGRVKKGVPILVMGVSGPADVRAVADINDRWSACGGEVHLGVGDREQLDRVRNESRGRCAATVWIHIKIDTGMSRLGALWSDKEGLKRLANGVCGGGGDGSNDDVVRLGGVFSHLAEADNWDEPESDRHTTEQIERFLNALAVLRSDLESSNTCWPPRFIHLANSAASMGPHARRLLAPPFSMFRVGIAAYGLEPSFSCVPKPPILARALRPALSWFAAVTSVKRLPAGSRISYGGTFEVGTDKSCGGGSAADDGGSTDGKDGGALVATLACGYADGWRRVVHDPPAGHVNACLIMGVRCPVLGRVCMDQCVVSLDALPVELARQVCSGTVATLIGVGRPCREVAIAWHQITYDVVCGITKRVKRHYV